MKKVDNPGQPQKGNSLAISVTLDEIPLLTTMVEKLANRHYDYGYSHEPMPAGWEAIDPSSIEAYVSGSLHVQAEGEEISMAYTTCFTFTCVKPAGGKNRLMWINSLS